MVRMFTHTLLPVWLVCLCFKEAAGQTTSQLPTFTLHPQSDILAPGESTNLTCSASSPTPLSYGWLRDGVSLDGESLPWYVVTMGTNGEGAGRYSCLANNDLGTVTSRVANVQQAVIMQSFFSTSATSPHLVSISLGQTAVISCGSYTSVPEAPLSWELYDEFNNIRLDAVHDKAIVGLSGDLYLQDASQVNGGTYECRASNRDTGTIVTGFVQVTVEATGDTPSSPEILSPPQNMVVNEGDDAFFECIVGGRPLASVEWTLPSGLSDIRYAQNSAVLRVRNVGAGDVGVYMCSASGVGIFTASLSIAQSPVIATPLPSSLMTVVYGSALSLQCGSTQSTGEWEWFFNGERLPDEAGPSLELASAVLESSGVYQCFVSNSAGFDSSTALVEIVTIPVTISAQLPSPQVAFMNQPLELTCAADGAPPPTYIWMKESIPLASGLAFNLSDTGVLTVRNVDSTSGGNYTCVARNSVGGVVVGSATTSTIVTAIAPTALTAEAGPLFKIQIGTTGSLTCEVNSDPNAQVAFSWTKDGVDLNVGGRLSYVSVTSGTLRVTMAETADAGVYVCIVSTRHNGILGPLVKSTPTSLTIIDTPVSPMIISVTATSPTSLNIQWFYPGSSSDLSSYIIELQPSGEGGWSQVKTQPASLTTTADINGLTPYTTYNVRVVAVTTGGVSSDRISEVANVSALADLPSGPPLMISVRAPNNTALRISWQEPAVTNGRITDYILQYRLLRDQAEVDYTTVRVGSGTAQTFVIAGLEPLERYEYRLAAENIAGLGPYSDIQFADVIAPGIVTEPEPGPFYTQIWFIVVMVIVVLVVIAMVATVILVVRYFVQRNKARSTYSFTSKIRRRTSSVHSEHGGELTHEAYKDYCAPRTPNLVELQTFTNNGTDMESEPDFTDTQSIPYSTPQLSASSRTHLVPPGPAPGYIHPPSFQEAISHSRTHSVHSMRSSLGEKPVDQYYDEEPDLKEEYIDEPLSNVDVNKEAMVEEDYKQQVSRQDSYRAYQVPGGFRVSDIEDQLDNDSIGKPSLVSSSGTEYSHLQAIADTGYPHLQTVQANSDHATFV